MFNVYYSQKEKEIAIALQDKIKDHGYEVIRVRNFHDRRSKNIQIMIDKDDGTPVTIQDCEGVHIFLLQILKTNELRKFSDYSFEISSPGINKPLTRLQDFQNNKGKLIKVITLFKIANKKKFVGYLQEVQNDCIIIRMFECGESVAIRFDSISEAYLEYEKK